MANKAPEEATVRVLPNCTGKVLGSKTGEIYEWCLARQYLNHALHSSFTNNHKAQLCDLLSRSGI